MGLGQFACWAWTHFACWTWALAHLSVELEFEFGSICSAGLDPLFLGIVANLAIKFKIIKYIAIFLKNCKYSKICQNLSMIESITDKPCCKNWSITNRSYEFISDTSLSAIVLLYLQFF